MHSKALFKANAIETTRFSKASGVDCGKWETGRVVGVVLLIFVLDAYLANKASIAQWSNGRFGIP